MSSPTNKYRPNTLVNLGDFVRGEIGPSQHGSPPVSVPKRPGQSASRPINSAPAAKHRHVAFKGPVGYRREDIPSEGYSASLVDPVMEDGEVMSTSATSGSSINSSLLQRHRDAAGWSSHPGYGSMPHVGVGGGGSNHPDFIKSVNVENEYIKIQARNETKRQDHSTTNFQTFIHVLKGNIGTGLLALPLAVKNAGMLLGPIALLAMGIIATHCMILLLEVANYLCKKTNVNCLNYAETATVAIGNVTSKPKLLKAAGIVVNVFLLITQFGFCSVYFVFIAQSLDTVFCEALAVTIGKQAWIAILIIPVVLFCWIRNLESLAPFSMVANLCILFSLAVIFYEEINSFFSFNIDEKAAIIREPEKFEYFGSVKSIALFFGSVVYAFEGIGMVLPLENKMKKPEQARSVVYKAMVVVTLLYFSFGTIGYIVYGNNIKASITLNLHSSMRLWASILFVIVKLYFAYAIFASFMLQFYVPMDFLLPAFFNLIKVDRLPYYFPQHHEKLKYGIELIFRTVLVLGTAVIALAVPDLEDLIALIGAVASSALAFIFPSLLELVTFWPVRNERKFFWVCPWQVWVVKDFLILALGVAGLLFGTYASIASIVVNIGKKDVSCELSLFRH